MTSESEPTRLRDDPLPDLLAKSASRGRAPETLAYHLDATLRAAEMVRERVGRVATADAMLGGDFWRAARFGALTHDAGKVAAGFQRMLTHGDPWGHRHELLSLGFLPWLLPDSPLRSWVASAVVTHHRPLTGGKRRSLERQYGTYDVQTLRQELGAVDPDAVRRLACWLVARADAAGLRPAGTSPPGDGDLVEQAQRLFHEVLDAWECRVEDPANGIVAVLLQGAVTLADHLSSSHGRWQASQPLTPDFAQRLRKRLGGQLHRHQEQAAEVHGHLLLRAPTGSGKTEAALLWAVTQVDQVAQDSGGCPRLFYTLPYLASINAMAGRFASLLPGGDRAVGVSHSRAASYYLTTSIAPSEDGDRSAVARKAVARASATRLFRETIRVGTPYQLLRGALAGAAHSGVLLDAANSVFVLDELHAYDAQRLGYVLAIAGLWERLGGRIAVLSATLPDALVALLRDTLRASLTLVEAPRELHLPRHRLRVRQRHLTDPESLVEARQRLAADEAVLVVANNVAHAQELYAVLAPEVRQRHGAEAAILLHSRFRRGDRSAIEERIGARFGTRGERSPGLVVATQVVEVSLDVDFDVLFTAAAPLEAILQRFGRVNRLGRRPPADVIVHAPEYRARRRGQGEYADGVYPREPVAHGWQIMCRHDGEVVDEAAAVGWLDEVYRSSWGSQWRAEVDDHRRRFEEAFLRFDYPYDSREDLEQCFEEMFEGTEAVLSEDLPTYREALVAPTAEDGRTDRRAGRLLAEEYLVPLPYWAARLCQWDRQLKVAVVDGAYDSEHGLTAVHGPEQVQSAYRLGEVL